MREQRLLSVFHRCLRVSWLAIDIVPDAPASGVSIKQLPETIAHSNRRIVTGTFCFCACSPGRRYADPLPSIRYVSSGIATSLTGPTQGQSHHPDENSLVRQHPQLVHRQYVHIHEREGHLALTRLDQRTTPDLYPRTCTPPRGRPERTIHDGKVREHPGNHRVFVTVEDSDRCPMIENSASPAGIEPATPRLGGECSIR
jgi:hypothetical protein